MATPSTECYCSMSELDLLKLIYEQERASFDRQQQIIQAINSPAGGGGNVNLSGINAVAPSVNNGAADAGSLRVVIANDNASITVDALDLDIRNLVFATDKVDASGTTLGANSGVDIGDVTINNGAGAAAVNIQDGGNSITIDGTVTATPTGTQDTNIIQLLGVAPSATNPFPARPTNGTAFLANLGETAATGQFTRITDGTDTALVTAAGEQNVLSTAQPGVDIGDVTINNAAGAAAVNIQDGGNSITVDGTVTATPTGTQDTNLIQIAGNAVSAGNGTSGTGVLRVAQVSDGTGVLATVSTVTTLTGGGVAHDGVDSGNPIKVGAKAITSLATTTLVASADRTDNQSDLDGALIVRPQVPLGDLKTDAISDTAGTSVASTVFTAVASTKNYITSMHVFRTDGGTTTQYVDFRDGTAGAVLYRVALPPNGGAVLAAGGIPYFKTSANTALAYDVSSALTTVYINVGGFQSKIS